MAHVNGRAIPMDRLHELLVHGYGLAIAKQIISTEIVRRAATEKDITVSDEEVDAEHERTLKLTFPTPASDDERAQMLSQLLQSRNITRDTWRLIMLRNALLRRLVGTDFEVPDDAVGTEFRQRYGRKVVVRHVETKSLAAAKLVKSLAVNMDFAELAKQYSVNPSGQNGGLLPPISKDTRQVSPALRQVAMALRKVGDVSDPVQVAGRFHILKLDKILEPKDVRVADVRDRIVADLKERIIRAAGNHLLQQLMQKAQIELVDPSLKRQDEAAAKADKGPSP